MYFEIIHESFYTIDIKNINNNKIINLLKNHLHNKEDRRDYDWIGSYLYYKFVLLESLSLPKNSSPPAPAMKSPFLISRDLATASAASLKEYIFSNIGRLFYFSQKMFISSEETKSG